MKQRMMEVVVTTGAISRAKFTSKCHHQQLPRSLPTPESMPTPESGTNAAPKIPKPDIMNKPTSSFFTGRMPFLSPNQQCQSNEGKTMMIVVIIIIIIIIN